MNHSTTTQVEQPRCRGQPKAPGERAPIHPTVSEGSIMIRSIITAIAAASIALLGAGVASADVTSQSTSEESHQSNDSTGSSNDAVDHMSNDGPGIVEGDTPGHVWQVIKRTPRVDENGDPVLGSNGLQIIDLTWGSVPVGSGPAPATIIHNP